MLGFFILSGVVLYGVALLLSCAANPPASANSSAVFYQVYAGGQYAFTRELASEVALEIQSRYGFVDYNNYFNVEVYKYLRGDYIKIPNVEIKSRTNSYDG